MAEPESDHMEIEWRTGLEIYEERMENGELREFEKTDEQSEGGGDDN